jgi:tricarballylate dehydrogenase
MVKNSSSNLVVIGHGAAGLAAALAAAEEARRLALRVSITVLEKASEDQSGGNTRWSPSYMRMAAPDRVEPSFERDMHDATDGKGDRRYFARLAVEAPATVAWIAAHGIAFHAPTYYLAKGPPRIQPVGGGPALVAGLVRAAHNAGVAIRYGSPAGGLDHVGGRLRGVSIAPDRGPPATIAAGAIILASGGFAGDGAMMREHFGAGGENMRLISPGTRFATGDGIRMAAALGAEVSGDWNGMHCEPIDPRSQNSAPVVLVYPYGIVVNRDGDRFFDEGGGLVHETWEHFARRIHFATPGATAWAILDRRLFEIAGYERAIRSEVPPFQADTLAALAAKAGIDAKNLAATVAAYNAAATGDPAIFDATRCDGLAASSSLAPPKSNWARAIVQPPYLTYPLIGAVAYTFGGLATNEKAEVLRDGRPLPGLYAAGEITGHFYGTAPNAVSVLRALVYGRIAGIEAISYLRSAQAAG